MKFYDREKELSALKKYEKLSSSHAQFIVMTGRRRIGKTALIKQAFTEIPFLYFFVEISIPKLEEKAVKVLAYHKQWDAKFVGLSLNDM